MTTNVGRSPAGPGSRASHEAASASSPEASIPNALEDLSAIPASFAGSTNASIAISLKRIADMMEEDRKPRLELMPEGYIGEQEHLRIVRDTLLRDVIAWEAIADAATYIAGRMPLPASAIEARRAETQGGSVADESATGEAGDAQGADA